MLTTPVVKFRRFNIRVTCHPLGDVMEDTAEKTFTGSALRNPSSAKRKCRRIRNTLILGLACMIHKSLGICESCRLVH